jgi:hypothetical protein
MEGTIIRSVILETTAVFSEDQRKRFELTKEFKGIKDGKSIVVIMLNAASKEIQETDRTVNTLINQLSSSGLNYSKLTILNLVPDIMNKLNPARVDSLDSNFEYVKEVLARGYDNILIGYGNNFIGNRVVETAKYRLNCILKEYEDILVEIGDEFDTYNCSPMHPLFAALRIDKWVLKTYKLPKQELEPSQESPRDKIEKIETEVQKGKRSKKVVN